MKNQQRSIYQLVLFLQQKKNSQGGYSLVITLASILLLGTLLVTAALVSKVDSASTNASRNSNSGFYSAEAGLTLRANQIREEFEGFNRPSGNSPAQWEDCIDTNNSNDGDNDFACESNLFINSQQIVTYGIDRTGNTPISVTVADGAFAGLNAQEYRYDYFSTALKEDGQQKSPTAILGLRFKSRLVPLFQFAAFYNSDLSFSFPPNMTMNGRVHSNGDIYFNAGGESGTNTLAVTGIVTTPGTMYRGQKTQNDDCRENVTVFDGSNQRALDCGSSGARKAYAQSDVSDWNGNIRIGDPDLTLKVPELETFEMPPSNVISSDTLREDYEYWNKADLRLVLKLDNSNNPSSIDVLNPNGSINATATSNLNACTPVQSTIENEPGGGGANYERSDTQVGVASTNNFSTGDFVQLGNDFDSNVISSISASNNTLTIKRQIGHTYQAEPITKKDEVVKKAVVSTSDTFYNYREKNGATGVDEGTFIRMLNVDVQELLNCIDSSNSIMGGKDLDDDTEGGLVWFLAVDGPDSHTDVVNNNLDTPNNYGIRLYNASELASSNSGAKNVQGLTIVSDQAVYTQGNYNSTNKIPASIIADSINVLSTAWNNDDSNGRAYNSSNLLDTTSATTQDVTDLECDSDDNCWWNYGDTARDADNTTVNAAFFSGQDFEGGGDGSDFQDKGDDTSSGGVNNYPRFHEDWDGSQNCGSPGRCTLTYLGSMVTFGKAQRVDGDFCSSYRSFWGACNIYTPPTRNWSYDTDFNDAANLPPMTPRAVYLSQELFERDFTYTSSNPLDSFFTALSHPYKPKNSNYSATHPLFQTSFSL